MGGDDRKFLDGGGSDGKFQWPHRWEAEEEKKTRRPAQWRRW
jgi:hypothetical protein